MRTHFGSSGSYPLKYLAGPHLHSPWAYPQLLKKLMQEDSQVRADSRSTSHLGKLIQHMYRMYAWSKNRSTK